MKTKNLESKIEKYQPSEIESKWQKRWTEENIYGSDLSGENKYYVLAEFAYASGDLHMGHWFTFCGADIFARSKRMQGHQIFFPNGFDAFGLPAENAAIQRKVHPKDWTLKNIAKMKEQYGSMGGSFSFDHEVITCEPQYYKWNQWIFLQMYKKGLAYQKESLSNWCPTDQTVLANEGVEDGRCWRCGSEIIQKPVKQWFLKITEYADRLLWPEKVKETNETSPFGTETKGPNASVSSGSSVPSATSELDWPKSVRVAQNQWIGRSEGVQIEFKIQNSKFKIEVFTTALDTVYGVTFMVLSPEHPLLNDIVAQKQKNAVEEYILQAQGKSELERTALEKNKTGVFTGSYAINPFNEEEVAIWVADYVLMTYGTGAVMGVAGHDARDHEFAKKYRLDIIPVIKPSEDAKDSRLEEDGFWDYTEIKTQYADKSVLFDSGLFNGLTSKEAKKKMEEFIEEKGLGKRAVQYHLRDWSVSRQRYWGTPVPMIHCSSCGIVPVPEDQLPIELPYDVDYTPKGKPPLASNEKWLSVQCPKCGNGAKRDAETLDTFFDSSWYFFRYIDPQNEKQPFDKLRASQAMPVDIYFGGAEHTLGHTLYSRFFTKFFKDIGLTDLDEYALKRVNHGVVLGSDRHRMSKSRGNVVNPDEEVKKYGADTIRVYLAFFIPYDGTGTWESDRVWGAHRFLQRIWALQASVQRLASSVGLSKEDLRQKHKTIKKVTEDIENIKFNTAVAALMEWLNYLYQISNIKNQKVSIEEYRTYLLLLAPFAPHVSEELWQKLNGTNETSPFGTETKGPNASGSSGSFDSIHQQPWPRFDPSLLEEDEVTIVVQVNGKVRETIKIQNSKFKIQNYVEEKARESEKVQRYLQNSRLKRVVYIEGKVLNFVVES